MITNNSRSSCVCLFVCLFVCLSVGLLVCMPNTKLFNKQQQQTDKQCVTNEPSTATKEQQAVRDKRAFYCNKTTTTSSSNKQT